MNSVCVLETMGDEVEGWVWNQISKMFGFCAEDEGEQIKGCKSGWRDVIIFAFGKLKMVTMWRLDEGVRLREWLLFGDSYNSAGDK